MAFDDAMRDMVILVKQDGRRFDNIRAVVSPTRIIIDDASLPVEEGDRFHRTIPSGLTEVYLVLDRGFYAGLAGTPDHYQVSVRKETALPARQPGQVIYNIVSGPNPHLNINSVDLSASVVQVTSEKLFDELRAAVAGAIQDPARRDAILGAIGLMQQTQGKKSFAARYREFVALAADHMALVGPFIPALSQLLS
jgi:hypothetical protein